MKSRGLPARCGCWTVTITHDTLTVYTDIDEAMDIAFGEAYNITTGALEFADAEIPDGGEVNEEGEVSRTSKKIESDDFVKVNDATHAFNMTGPGEDEPIMSNSKARTTMRPACTGAPSPPHARRSERATAR